MSNIADIAGTSTEQPKAKLSTKDELGALEVELKKLEVLEKQANLQDITERLAERELKRETKKQRSLTNGQTLKQLENGYEATQKRCNHRKGGDGANGVILGRGQDDQYAVLKHVFANGDTWVRCLRCAKTWKPPVHESYKSEELYLKAIAEYETALNFPTRNHTSGSIQFRFSDNGEYYRQVTASTNLR